MSESERSVFANSMAAINSRQMISLADHIIELEPLAGTGGGEFAKVAESAE